uniref:Uncharacterized protein n=1 Tax=Beet leafhopper transmitted virescence phytoplasma TaxID=37694 RepID=Q6JKN3_9MOLU|nr:hypothetical protein [Beet leafhopper transmitted virescence phytoplasma]AAR84207.1 unknown [Beet leafhopper transmitted virescence phytoplasma]
MKTKTNKKNNKSALAAIWISLLSLLMNLGSLAIQILGALLTAILPLIIFAGIWLLMQALHLVKKPFNKPSSHNPTTNEIRVSQKESQLATKKLQEAYNNNFAIDSIVLLKQEALKQMALQKPTVITNNQSVIETKKQYQPSTNNDNTKSGLTNEEIMTFVGYGALALGIGAVAVASGGSALPLLALL